MSKSQYAKPWDHYMNEMHRCTSYPDMLKACLFPNAKEVTESASAYANVRNLGVFRLDDPEVVLVVAGDGHTPRTAAMFAYRSAWQCHSVDPALRTSKDWPVKRLTVHKKKIENFHIKAEKLVLVAVHSHASLIVADINCQAPRKLILAMPCCVPQELTRHPDRESKDFGVWSPHNTWRVWMPGGPC